MENKIVTREDCYLIINKCVDSGTFEIVNFKVIPFEDKEREYYKPNSILEISIKISKNVSRFRFFLKNFSTPYAPLNELTSYAKACEHELYFYENFLPSLTQALKDYGGDFVPYYLLSKTNDVMIIEDMSLRSYVVAKKVNPHVLDRFHVCLALQSLAKLHAGSLCYEQLKLKGGRLITEGNWLSQDAFWKKEEHLGFKVIQSGIKGVKTLLAQLQQLETLDDSLSQKIDGLVEQCLEIVKPQTSYRNVFCHGNLHTKNLLFKYERLSPVDCTFLNFEFCRYYLPAYDVLTLISFTTSKLFRQHYFTYLIQYYHDCLHKEVTKQGYHIDQFLSFEELKESINYLIPLIKLNTVLHLQECGAKDGFYKIIQKDENAYRHFLFEDRSTFLSEVIKKDPIFKVMIIEALEELLDTLNDSRISREMCYEILEKRLDTTVYDLNEFYISTSQEGTKLTMLVCTDNKEGVVNEYKYLISTDANNKIEVMDQIQ